MRLYAVGDVHGCLKQLNRVIAAIEADREKRPAPKSGIIFLGDYLDRGPESKGVVTRLIHLMARDKSVLCLAGNHDLALQKFLDFPLDTGENYFSNGGASTLRSYGVRVPRPPFTKREVKEIVAYAQQLIPVNHLHFFATLPHGAEYGDYFFCHAGIRPGVALDKQSPEDLMWIRRDFLDYKKPLEKVVVHGHTPRDDVEFHKNRISVDTRCFASGKLSCVVLEGKDYRVLKTL
ncbi:metallophosphoesterase family protein [Pseudahrensia aquimaris]|uniref:Metallophosphoesterase family protein n=2 Tax=Pseudahrensia aquimaris TaxID=744461 RepID=A0ABW3FD97_9HYPH